MANRFYRPRLGSLMKDTPSLAPAAVFYLIYIFGLTMLVILPAIKDQFSFTKTFLYGAIFGLTAYATYDLTNQATLKSWPTSVTVVDIIWGALLTGIVTVISVYITKKF